MMIYLWEIPNEWPEDLIGEYVRSESVDRFTLIQGKEIAPDSKVVLRFVCSKVRLERLDNLPNSSMLPVVSPRLADVLKAHVGSECQLLRACVLASDGRLEGFRAVVAKKSIAIMDRQKSQYSTIPGTAAVMGIRSLVCRSEELCGLQMARDTEYLSNLFVSNELRLAVLSLEPKGLAFYAPAELID